MTVFSSARLAGLLLACGVVVSCTDQRPAARIDVDDRVATKGCTGFATRPGAARTVRAYPNVKFEGAVQLVHHPSEPYWYVVQQGGTIRRFADRADVDSSELVVDLNDAIHLSSLEDGLLGLAFEPSFGVSGGVIVKYTKPVDGDTSVVRTTLARMRSDDGGATFARDSLSDFLAIERPQVLHHGGPPRFGPDGYLYAPMGDGGWEPELRAQDPSTLEGTVLRIDTSVVPYRVPPDNPFVSTPGARPEIYALGLRNPFGSTFEPATGALLVGDVGLATYEEVNRIAPGGNYGWPLREGPQCLHPDGLGCDATGFVDPLYTYLNYGGSAIVVGAVYRGSRIPSATGHLVFGDYVTGRIEHLEQERPGEGPAVSKLLVEAGLNITAITEDPDGEILVVDHLGGIWRLDAAEDVRAVPDRLSDTGCMDMRTPLTAPAGLIPYDVNMPLWSDGADKARWMSLPPGKTVHVLDDGSWEFPVGAVLVKSFFANEHPIETRLLVRHDDGEWAGYSYEWSEDGKDAQLLQGGKSVVTHGVAWSFPSRGQCMACHTAAAGRTLGLQTAQLNGEFAYPGGVVDNQLTVLDRLAVFDRPLGDPSELPRFPARADADAPPDAWSRAYLHANCSHCHRPGGPGRGTANLMSTAPLAAAGCGTSPELDPLGVDDAQVISPMNPELSVLLLRMERVGAARMPPLGTTVPDTLAIEHLREWIGQTPACD